MMRLGGTGGLGPRLGGYDPQADMIATAHRMHHGIDEESQKISHEETYMHTHACMGMCKQRNAQSHKSMCMHAHPLNTDTHTRIHTYTD